MKKTHINKTWKELSKLTETTETKLITIVELMEARHHLSQSYYDDKSEKWQESEKGVEWEARMEEFQDGIDELHDARQEIIDLINNVLDKIENLTY